jgi:LPXTG-motif cell wall-anchored protein
MIKKFAMAIMAVSATVLGFGGAANAAYPPDDVTVTVSSKTPPSGSTITATIEGCVDGESATFVLEGSTATGVTTGGTASGQLKVPTAPGSYTGSATCASGASANFAITVPTPSGGLPATGSSGINSTVAMSAILLLVGVGLFAVSQIRRRQTATA